MTKKILVKNKKRRKKKNKEEQVGQKCIEEREMIDNEEGKERD